VTAEDFAHKGAYFWVFTADAEKNKRGPEIKGWKKILGMKRAKPGYYAERCGAPVSYCNEGFLKKSKNYSPLFLKSHSNRIVVLYRIYSALEI
jgi:hypothetical protein